MITGRLYIPVNQPLPPGKKMFQANVKGKNSAGYTIETVIDGKPLHGVLFKNQPNTLIPVPNTSSRYVFSFSLQFFTTMNLPFEKDGFNVMLDSQNRKRTFSEILSPASNGIHSQNVTAYKVLGQDRMQDKRELRGESSESHECHKDADTIVVSSNPTTVAESFKVN